MTDIAVGKEAFRCRELRNYLVRHPENKGKALVIFGAGFLGRQTLRTLKLIKDVIVAGVVDNSKAMQGKDAYGYIVESLESIREKYHDCVIFVAIQKLSQQMEVYYQLLSMGINEANILMCREGSLFCAYGDQYFDLESFQANPEGEVFVDAGCYDGATSLQAERWADNNLKKIIAYEADVKNIDKCKNNLKKLKCDFELHNLATWSKKTTLHFEMNDDFGYASRVNEKSVNCVEADSIDNTVGNERVTTIKLDVEGAELETLIGSVNTIKLYHPKLAISIYHKPQDVIEIPMFIESLQMNYKYYIRHYQTRHCETVLYAI